MRHDILWTDRAFVKGRRPNFGTDPFRHNIDVDLSHERMAKAFEAYKVRWAREEDAMRRLMEKKVVSKSNLSRLFSFSTNKLF